MLSLYLIMMIAIYSDSSVSPEVNFMRFMGKENVDDHQLTPENQAYINNLNEYLREWYSRVQGE